jgi:hypothetical protein
MKHTPGPWQSDGLGRVISVAPHKGIHGAWQKDICSLRDRINDLGTAAADARLIAAAPDLLVALHSVECALSVFLSGELSDVSAIERLAIASTIARTALDKAAV